MMIRYSKGGYFMTAQKTSTARFSGSDAVKRLTLTAILTGMNIALSSFGIPVPGGHLYLNDVIIVAAALILNPADAFIVGGVGAFLGDLFFYPTPMFVSLVTHGLQAVAISLISRKIKTEKPITAGSIAAFVGALINVVGYTIGRAYIYATPSAAMLKLPFQFLQAGVGAVAGVLLVYRFGLYEQAEKLLHR